MENILKVIKDKTSEGAAKIFVKTGEAATENCCFVFNFEPEIPKELQK